MHSILFLAIATITFFSSQTKCGLLTYVERITDLHGNYTDYFYDELGNTAEIRTYDSSGNHLTTTRTLYDTEGRAIVAVGPYEADVYADYPEDTSKWPVGTETVYDNLGRKEQVIVDGDIEQDFDYDAEGRIETDNVRYFSHF